MPDENDDASRPEHPRVVGTHEIAQRLDVPRDQVDKWRRRGGVRGVPFPAPRWRVGNRPAWDWGDVVAWWDAIGRTLPATAPSA